MPEKILGKFSWMGETKLTFDDAQSLMLIKGVCATSGEKKDGTNISRDDLVAGTGAMRAYAHEGKANIDIDHFRDKLPAEYKEEFGLENGTVGKILDCHYVDDDKIAKTEFIAKITDSKVYEMIKDGKFIGCSVLSMVRKLDCDEKKCTWDGSIFKDNTLILKSVPNRNGTWVSQVTEDDIGTIITEGENKDSIVLKDNGLEQYLDDGKWKTDKSAEEFLTKVKNLDAELSKEIAQHLNKNLQALSQYQLNNLSADDLKAWWESVKYQQDSFKKLKILEDRLTIQEKNTRRLCKLSHNQKGMQDLLKVLDGKRYGQSEVGYTDEAAENNCKDCRWFMPTDPESPEGVGECSEVADEVRGTGGCERFDRNPATPEESEEEPAEEEPAMEMPEKIPEGSAEIKRTLETKPVQDMIKPNEVRMAMLSEEYDRLSNMPQTQHTVLRKKQIQDEYRQLERVKKSC